MFSPDLGQCKLAKSCSYSLCIQVQGLETIRGVMTRSSEVSAVLCKATISGETITDSLGKRSCPHTRGKTALLMKKALENLGSKVSDSL